MNEAFNNNFRNDSFINTVPNQDTNINPNMIPYFGEGDNNAYIQGMNPPMPGSNQGLVPLQSSLAYPGLSPQVTQTPQGNYAKGGKVKKRKKGISEEIMMMEEQTPKYPNLMPSLAEVIRQHGEGEDVILAHINPLEAKMLGVLSNGGTLNPVTGLPQFGFIGGALGSVLGNLILPGIGGIAGGALGGMAESAIRGKKVGRGAMEGAGAGALGGLLGLGGGGGGLGGLLGGGGAGGGGLGGLASLLGSGGGGGAVAGAAGKGAAGKGEAAGLPANASFLGSLKHKSKDFFSSPQNLLTTAVGVSSLFNRPKKKTPEDLATEQKRFDLASLLSPEERAKKEAAMLAEEQMRRRVARNKFLPEERLGSIDPIYTKTHTPEEYKQSGRWMSYYNNPNLTGNPLMMKGGGSIPSYEEEISEYPSGLSYYLQGMDGGQDDTRPIMLDENDYVIDASTVANLGDGNGRAGANKISEHILKSKPKGIMSSGSAGKIPALVSDNEVIIKAPAVALFGGGNVNKGIKKLDKLVTNVRKHKSGSIKLPPKAKALTSYMGK